MDGTFSNKFPNEQPVLFLKIKLRIIFGLQIMELESKELSIGQVIGLIAL